MQPALLLTASLWLIAYPTPQPKAASLPPAERQQILQLLLDLPDLQPFYHAELPQRRPLKLLLGGFVTPDMRLVKFKQPVLLLAERQLRQRGIRDYVQFGLLQQRQDTLVFRLSYAIEGVLAEGKLIRKVNNWQTGSYSVVEH